MTQVAYGRQREDLNGLKSALAYLAASRAPLGASTDATAPQGCGLAKGD